MNPRIQQLSIATAAFALAGCSGNIPLSKHPHCAPNPDFERDWKTMKPVVNHPIIDVHTHAFNARYLPLRRVVESRKWGTAVWWLPRPCLEAVAVMITSGTPRDEKEAAAREGLIREWEAKHGPADTVGRRLAAMVATNKTKLKVEWPGERRRQLQRIAENKARSGDVRGSGNEITPLAWLSYHLGAKFVLGRVVTGLFSHGHEAASSDNSARTLLNLMSSEKQVRERMAADFPEVDLFVYQNMDLLPSFYEKDRLGTYTYSYSNDGNNDDGRTAKGEGNAAALPRIRKMCAESNGRMIHFVAWNPFRTLDYTPENKLRPALDVVKEAYKKGAVGVKFYPPLGYRPTGNNFEEIPKPWGVESRLQWRNRYEGHTGEELDRINEELFAWCEQKQIPIFAHCSTGEFRAYDDDAYANMAHPKYWELVLAKHKNLRLCLGHAGGITDWYRGCQTAEAKVEGEENWGAIVRKLCRQYEHVYCEFGIHEDVANPKLAEQIYNNLLVELPSRGTGKDAGPWKLEDKVMYGSDYYMPVTCSPQDYLDGFVKLFSLDGMGDYKKKFFYQNAENYLNRTVSNRWRAW